MKPFGLGDKQVNIVLDKIKPLIEEIADKRVKAVMKEIQQEQIEAYGKFFAGMEKRFTEIGQKWLNEELKERGITK